MGTQIHPQARTTPKVRQEIMDSGLSERAVAKAYNISRGTARKWMGRDDPQDRSHRALTRQTTLNPLQEAIVLYLRQALYFTLDDLLFVTKAYINADVSRSGLARCLKRHGVSRLEELSPQPDETGAPARRAGRRLLPGTLHLHVKRLPQLPGEPARGHLYLAIDRATRWLYARCYRQHDAASSADFLVRLQQAAPLAVRTVLTDDGAAFADPQRGAGHPFAAACATHQIAHRVLPQRPRPAAGANPGPVVGGGDAGASWAGAAGALLPHTSFADPAELEATLQNYVALYNHLIVQGALDDRTPLQALAAWREQRPGPGAAGLPSSAAGRSTTTC